MQEQSDIVLIERNDAEPSGPSPRPVLRPACPCRQKRNFPSSFGIETRSSRRSTLQPTKAAECGGVRVRLDLHRSGRQNLYPFCRCMAFGARSSDLICVFGFGDHRFRITDETATSDVELDDLHA